MQFNGVDNICMYNPRKHLTKTQSTTSLLEKIKDLSWDLLLIYLSSGLKMADVIQFSEM